MSLAQRFERRLEGMVGAAFARVFKGQVEPVEIGTALQREASDKKAVMGSGQVLTPNRYRVTLGDSDYERLEPWEAQLTRSLAELVQEYLDDNNLRTIGDIEVYLARDSSLHTGVFGVASRMEPQAAPRRRPLDSMSMPVVAGRPDEYVQPFEDGRPSAAAPNVAARAAAPFVSPTVPPGPVPPVPAYGAPPGPVPAYGAPPAPGPAYGAPPGPVRATAAVSPPPPAEPRRSPQFRAQLLVDGTPRSLTLNPGSNVIGRGQEADLQVLDQGVSRRHVEVRVEDARAIVHDLHSTNGTSVNGRAVQSHELKHGDVIRIGHTRLVFQRES
jgi:hypothetical protein